MLKKVGEREIVEWGGRGWQKETGGAEGIECIGGRTKGNRKDLQSGRKKMVANVRGR